MTLPRLLKWLAGIFLSLVLMMFLVASLFDWNLLRAPIARWVGDTTGRSFAINGELNVEFSWPPRIIANDIVLGNAAWSTEPNMAAIKRLDLTINPLRLLIGKLAFSEITLSEPHLILEVSQRGEPNWRFKTQDKSKSLELPSVDRLSIDHGSARYRDPAIKTDLSFALKTREASLEVTGKGLFQGLPSHLQAHGGALLSLRRVDNPYPIEASGMLVNTKFSVAGSLLDPLHFKAAQLNFTLAGNDLAQLFPIIGVPFPPTPPYKLAGFLDHMGEVWTFRRFKGTVGQSDISGDFAVDRSKQPQMITADLVSKQLVMKDLGGFVGAKPGLQPGLQPDSQPARHPPPGNKVLPTEPFNLEKLQAANADVQFRGENIISERLPLSKMKAHLIVTDGVLKLAPIDFVMAGGNLVSTIEMDGRQPLISTHADITAKGLHLDQMFPGSTLAGADTGTMGGRARLDGRGNSIAQMLASANGKTALIMDGGSVGELMLRLSNLDIANTFMALLGGDKQVPIRCMVGNFKAVDGNFTVKDLVLDTTKVNITGSGNVNFTDESLNLRLVPQSKGFSLASLRGPIVISGTFKNPVLRPEMGGIIARGGLAVALGAATSGIGTLIPLLDFGTELDSNCRALLSEAKSDAGIKTSDMAPRKRK